MTKVSLRGNVKEGSAISNRFCKTDSYRKTIKTPSDHNNITTKRNNVIELKPKRRYCFIVNFWIFLIKRRIAIENGIQSSIPVIKPGEIMPNTKDDEI